MIISAPFRNSNPRLAVIAGIVGLGLFALLADLWRVQVVNAALYGGRDQEQSLRRIRIPSARGEIFDRLGEPLANNRPSYDVAIYLDQLGRISKTQDIAEVAEADLTALSRALHKEVTLSDRDLRNHYRLRRPLPLPVWKNLSTEEVAAFEERASHLPGVDLIVTPVRQYPHHSLAAHVLGYVLKADESDEEDVERFYYYQPDSAGKQGVERACDEYLRGAPGGYTIRVNPAGRKVGEVGKKSAEVGDHVTLTLDMNIQMIVEEALAQAPVSAGKEPRGAAVVIDPRNGEILAMASLPTFDPNIFNPGTPASLVNEVLTNPNSRTLNRATRAWYPPGSTFKTVTLLAGLQAGKISLHDPPVECNGTMRLGNWPRPFRCSSWKEGGHGHVDAISAIAKSCDIYFYQKGIATGVEAIAATAREFGLGQSTGFDVGHDLDGLVPTPIWKKEKHRGSWYQGDTAYLAIGQNDLLVTPLQMACLAATFANRGTLWRPFLIKRVETSDGQLVRETNPEVRNRLSESPQNIEIVRQGMLEAVQSGTAHNAAVNGLSVAGKTGTAEVGPEGARINRTWLIAFAPYDQPQVAVAVVIEDGVTGGSTAGPVARAILTKIFHKQAENKQKTEVQSYAD